MHSLLPALLCVVWSDSSTGLAALCLRLPPTWVCIQLGRTCCDMVCVWEGGVGVVNRIESIMCCWVHMRLCVYNRCVSLPESNMHAQLLDYCGLHVIWFPCENWSHQKYVQFCMLFERWKCQQGKNIYF